MAEVRAGADDQLCADLVDDAPGKVRSRRIVHWDNDRAP